MLRVVRFVDNLIDRAMIVVFLLLFLAGGYIVLDAGQVYASAAANGITKTVITAENMDEIMQELSSDAVAWLIVDDTNVDYPVMHCDNNTKYLNTDPYGNYNIAGSIFMDCRNNGDFSDPYTIIYGHHMSHNIMFGALDLFEQEEYFNSHKTGRLLLNGKEYKLNIFAFAILDALDENVFSPLYHEGDSVLNYIRANALYLRDVGDGRIVALTTCREPGVTTRSLVFAEIVEDSVTDTDFSLDTADSLDDDKE